MGTEVGVGVGVGEGGRVGVRRSLGSFWKRWGSRGVIGGVMVVVRVGVGVGAGGAAGVGVGVGKAERCTTEARRSVMVG